MAAALLEAPALVREGRRERRARETRRRILLAALDLFAERGIDHVTVEEIADRADVARGTVFNHFASKDSLCHAMGELQVEMLRDAVADGRIHGPSAGEKIAQGMRVLAELPGRNPEQCRALLIRALATVRPGELPEHRRRVFEMFTAWTEEGQRAGELRGDLEPAALACFLMGTHLQATLLWALGFVEGSLVDHIECVLQLALEGIRKR